MHAALGRSVTAVVTSSAKVKSLAAVGGFELRDVLDPGCGMASPLAQNADARAERPASMVTTEPLV